MRQHYEVTVIGGGIHGAGVAQAAAAAGYQVLLLEKTDWAAGTSSKSSKLIHGGLRYLQSGQFGLVRESIREREILLKIAPQLVQRNSFYIPLYADSYYKGWQVRLALSLYALLGYNRKPCRFSVIPIDQATDLAGLNPQGLQQLFCYSDAQTDDRLLTRAVIDSAQSLGARVLAPAHFQQAAQVAAGYRLVYQYQGLEKQVLSNVVVNASGPWITRVNERVTPNPPTLNVDLVQGTHLILAGKLSKHCFYLEAPRDHRAIFVMPWYENTLLGTTETLFHGDPDEVQPLISEQEYLLETLRHYFPHFEARVIDAFAGLRVLPGDTAHRAFNRSRETQLVCDRADAPHWISIYGGKLTGYRATAEKVVALFAKILGKRKAIADTRSLSLALPAITDSQPVAPVKPRANSQNAG